MARLEFTTDEIVVAGLLSAISVVFQIIHVGVITPLHIWIDLVGVSWIMAYFLKGFRTALLTAVISSVLIALLAPSGFVGGIMKFVATVPMFIVPAVLFYGKDLKKKLKDLRFVSLALVAALVVRVVVTLLLNVYVAIPIWFGSSLEEVAGMAIKGFSDLFLLFGFSSFSQTVLGFSTNEAVLFVLSMIALINVIQGVTEFVIAWFISFMTQVGELDWS